MGIAEFWIAGTTAGYFTLGWIICFLCTLKNYSPINEEMLKDEGIYIFLFWPVVPIVLVAKWIENHVTISPWAAAKAYEARRNRRLVEKREAEIKASLNHKAAV